MGVNEMSTYVTLLDAYQMRKDAERQIREILTELEQGTGAWIAGVSVERANSDYIGEELMLKPITVKVRLEV